MSSRTARRKDTPANATALVERSEPIGWAESYLLVIGLMQQCPLLTPGSTAK